MEVGQRSTDQPGDSGDSEDRPRRRATDEAWGKVLVQAGVIDQAQLQALLQEAGEERLAARVVAQGVLTEERLLGILSKHLKMELVEPAKAPVHEQVLAQILPHIARTHRIIPIARRRAGDTQTLVIATADPFDAAAKSAISEIMGPDVQIEYLLSGDEDMERGLDAHYPPPERNESSGEQTERLTGAMIDDLNQTLDEAAPFDLLDDPPFADAEIIESLDDEPAPIGAPIEAVEAEDPLEPTSTSEPAPLRPGSFAADDLLDDAVGDRTDRALAPGLSTDAPAPAFTPSVVGAGRKITETGRIELDRRSDPVPAPVPAPIPAEREDSETSVTAVGSHPGVPAVTPKVEEKIKHEEATAAGPAPRVRVGGSALNVPVERTVQADGLITSERPVEPPPRDGLTGAWGRGAKPKRKRSSAVQVKSAELAPEAPLRTRDASSTIEVERDEPDTNVGPEPRQDTLPGAPLNERPALDGDEGFGEDSTVGSPLQNSAVMHGVAEEVVSARVHDPASADRQGPQRALEPFVEPQTDEFSEDSLKIGDYELGARIGVDASAELYRATKGQQGESVVVRRMAPGQQKREVTKARFFGQARRAQALNHANIVKVLDVGEDDQECFVVLESVEGPTLEKVLARPGRGAFPLPLAVYVTQEILKALAHAHASMDGGKGLVHGAVSPSVVRVTHNGQVKVGDFGVQQGLVPGHASYSAPELRDGAEPDERSDVFSTGLILFELLAGAPLSDRAVGQETLSDLNKTLAERCGALPPELLHVLKTSLDPLPERRYARAGEFLKALHGAQGPIGAEAGPEQLRVYVDQLFKSQPTQPSPKDRALAWIDAVQERAGPALERGRAKAIELYEQAQRSEAAARFRAAPKPAQLAVLLAPVALILLIAVIWAVASDDEEVLTETILIEPKGKPTRIDPTPIDKVDPAEENAKTTEVTPVTSVESPSEAAPQPAAHEILPGVFDNRAPQGLAFIARSGIELHITAEADSEPAVWLDVGQLVQKMGQVEGFELVMVPPRGPTGFIKPEDLTARKPIERLAKEIAFEGCKLPAGGQLDDCFFTAKQSLDKCQNKCQDFAPLIDHAGPPKSRCVLACEAAFERCVDGCKASQAAQEKASSRRRRKRRKRR